MTEVKPTSDTNKDAAHKGQAETDAAHKLCADAKPCPKPAEKKDEGWSLNSLVESASNLMKDVLPVLHLTDSAAPKPAAAAPKAADTHKATAAPKVTETAVATAALAEAPKAVAKPVEAAKHEPTALESAIKMAQEAGSAAYNAGSAAINFITGHTDAPAQPEGGKPATDKPSAVKPSGEKPQTALDTALDMAATVGSVAATVASVATNSFGAAAAAAGSVFDKVSDEDLKKSFASYEVSDKAFSKEEFLKDCNTGNSCKIEPTSNPTTIGGLNFNVKPTSDNVNTNSSQSADLTGGDLSATQLRDLLVNVDKSERRQYTDPLKELSFMTERTADGFIHRKFDGTVDFERHGDIETRHNEGGTRTEFNVKTGEKVLKDASGKIIFTFDKNGLNGTTPDGSRIEIDPRQNYATFTTDGKKQTIAFDRQGNLQETIGDTNITTSNDSAGDALAKAGEEVGDLINGKGTIIRLTNGVQIKSPDGSSMIVADDGTAAMTLKDGTKVMAETGPDGKPKITVYYKDGRPPQELSMEQIDKVFGADKGAIGGLINRLRQFSQTGVLEDGNGNSLTTASDGTVTAQTADATVSSNTTTPATTDQITITDRRTSDQQTVDLAAKTVEIKNAEGVWQGTLDFSKKDSPPSFTTEGYSYRNNEVTTKNGDVYTVNDGIRFHDGYRFENNGIIRDNQGHSFDADGEASFTNERSGSSKGSSGAQREAESSKAKAQVSQAESIASSIRSRVASGHVSASDVAALYGAMSSLTAMVGSLAQFDGSGVLAEAMLAKDDIAGSLAQANGELDQKHARQALAVANINAGVSSAA